MDSDAGCVGYFIGDATDIRTRYTNTVFLFFLFTKSYHSFQRRVQITFDTGISRVTLFPFVILLIWNFKLKWFKSKKGNKWKKQNESGRANERIEKAKNDWFTLRNTYENNTNCWIIWISSLFFLYTLCYSIHLLFIVTINVCIICWTMIFYFICSLCTHIFL